MEALIAPRGLIVDLITPLKNDRSIDGRGLERLLDRITPHAQAILLAGPGGGEGKNLELGQRLELVEKSLRSLKDIYHQMPVPILKGVLSDMGIIETPICAFPAENPEEPKRHAKELMARFGNSYEVQV
jgi:hypothetical protein